MTQILKKGQKVTKIESKVWNVISIRAKWTDLRNIKCIQISPSKLQNLNNVQSVTNSDQSSKSDKIWTMSKMSQILNKGQKVTKSEQPFFDHLKI